MKNPEASITQDAEELVILAIPIIFTFLLEFLPPTLAMAFAGHFPSESRSLNIAAASLASTYNSIFAALAVYGIATSLDTLCPQSIGVGRPKDMSIYVQSCISILLIVCIPIFFVNWYACDVLMVLGQDPSIAAAAGSFIRVSFWSTPFLAVYECLKKPLQAGSNIWPMIMSAIYGNISIVVFGYLFCLGPLRNLGLGFKGAALASVLGVVVMALSLVYSVLISDAGRLKYGKFWTGFDRNEAWDISRVRKVLGLGIPGYFMLAFEFSAFESQTIVSGLISPKEVSVGSFSIMLQVVSTTFMCYLGTSVATSVLVGRSVGAGEASRAKRFASLGVGIVVLLASALAILLISFRKAAPLIFTSDKDIVEATTHLIKYGAFFQLVDGVQGVCGGVFRAVGLQSLAAGLVFLAFYVIGIPLGLFFAFSRDMGVRGLWLGLSSGLFANAVIGIYFLIIRDDWKMWTENLACEKNDNSSKEDTDSDLSESTALIP